MADFSQAVELVLQHEGGYEPPSAGDPGGETKFGISKRWYPDVDIKNLTIEGATAIYLRDYWAPWIAELADQQLANCALDAAVNQGQPTAHNMLTLNPTLRGFQLARLLRYAATGAASDFHSWFGRTLDV